MSAEKKNLLFFGFAVLVVVILCLMAWDLWKNPTVKGQAAMIGGLHASKSLAEAKARTAKDRITKNTELAEAEKLYNEARAKCQGCISLIIAGLDIGFDDESVKQLQSMMTAANAATDKFRDWVDEHARLAGANTNIDIPGWLKELLSSGKDAVKGLYDDYKAKQQAEREKMKQNLRNAEWVEWCLPNQKGLGCGAGSHPAIRSV